jgi:hypothetical protein
MKGSHYTPPADVDAILALGPNNVPGEDTKGKSELLSWHTTMSQRRNPAWMVARIPTSDAAHNKTMRKRRDAADINRPRSQDAADTKRPTKVMTLLTRSEKQKSGRCRHKAKNQTWDAAQVPTKQRGSRDGTPPTIAISNKRSQGPCPMLSM